jgi:hypothetical protein
MTTGEETKGSDIYRAGYLGGDGVQVSVIMRLTLVTGVRLNEQPVDLEAGEGAQVIVPSPDARLQTQDADQDDKPGDQERTGHLR